MLTADFNISHFNPHLGENKTYGKAAGGEVGVVLDESLASLSLTPVRRPMQRRPPVLVTRVYVSPGLQE